MPRDHIVQPIDLRPYIGAATVGALMLAPSAYQAFQILQVQGAADAATILGGILLVLIAFTLIYGSVVSANPRRKQ